VVQRLFDVLELGGGFGLRVVSAFRGQLGEDLDVLEFLQLLAPRGQRFGELGALLQDLLCLFAVVPEIGRCGLRVECGDAFFASGDVKDASRRY
jgi:hypothetical protein